MANRFKDLSVYEKRILLASLIGRIKEILCVLEDDYTYFDMQEHELDSVAFHELRDFRGEMNIDDLLSVLSVANYKIRECHQLLEKCDEEEKSRDNYGEAKDEH